ncbi:hypothetical protein PAPHI01_1281 [Pancytospora philotis]|nr:hypothetical protein PAPHI01_1281 [Pancytospora philotis]
MLTGVNVLLIMVCRDYGAAAANAPELARNDYANFAKVGVAGHTLLEDQVLDSLYRRCSEYDCPEIKRAVLDAQLPNINFEDKARYVVLSAQRKDRQPEAFERLLAVFGHTGCLLLRRLFSDHSVESLAEISEAGNDTETCREFRRVAMRSRCALKGTYRMLEERMVDESTRGLLQLAEVGSGQDLAIHTIKAMHSSNKLTLSSAFMEIVESWPVNPGRLLPVVIEFLQIVLGLYFRRADGQAELRDSIVGHVYATCDTERECFELLRGFPNQQVLSRTMQKCVFKRLNSDVSQSFVRKYLAHMRKHLLKPNEGIYYFFQTLLPPVAEFHASKINWNSDPQLFNLISPNWLHKMFAGLCSGAPKGCDAVVLTRRYMDMLDYAVFVRILIQLNTKQCKILADFMLKNQRPCAREAYRNSCVRDHKCKELTRRYRKVLKVLDDIFAHIAADHPTPNERSQEMSSADVLRL